ncbi:cyclophilin-like fold protein [Actinomadura sp. 6N118]|uniref:cyclophilin-like fold protein n=1 Tax=Actinomadura sp. 6N118 TaxID=3375151 RepID=UPI0037B1EE84
MRASRLRRLCGHVAGVGPVGALVTPMLLVAGVVLAACSNTDPAAGPTGGTSGTGSTGATAGPADSGTNRIRLRVVGAEGRREATATLRDTTTARDFASLLPVTLRMHDLAGREKVGALPRALTAGTGQRTYEAGELGYWAPSNDVAIYYRDDGARIPSPGIVIIGRIDSGPDVIADAGGDFELTIEPAR